MKTKVSHPEKPINEQQTGNNRQLAADEKEDTQVERGKTETRPKIIGFLCNWCSYAGADLAGSLRIEYPANMRIIRVPCSGKVDPLYVLRALAQGIDGVLVAGCHPGDCHYVEGNYFARRRMLMLKKLLDYMGIDSRRLRLEWVSAAEGTRFAKIVSEFTKALNELRAERAGDLWN